LWTLARYWWGKSVYRSVGDIWLVTYEFICKNRDGAFFAKFSKFPGPIKKSRRCKNGTDILYLRAKFGGDLPLYGGVRKKCYEVFCFFLFVTLWILNLNEGLAHKRFSHSCSDIVVICGSMLMRILAFIKWRSVLSNVWKDIWTMPQSGATFVLELGQNLFFFLKIRRA